MATYASNPRGNKTGNDAEVRLGIRTQSHDHLAVNQIIERVFKSAWQYLLLKRDRDELVLPVGVVFAMDHG